MFEERGDIYLDPQYATTAIAIHHFNKSVCLHFLELIAQSRNCLDPVQHCMELKLQNIMSLYKTEMTKYCESPVGVIESMTEM